ncbi:MAG: hypothetical protein QOD72_3515, partial [Acidimicrobiaceae bacterium]|nr:hypothetical protein [Acidimicrobiaceae bacterium]
MLELAEGVAGPYAGKLFADLGADVIKVEPPGGDRSRRFGLGARSDGMSSAFVHLNTNKRSVVADLADARGIERTLELAARSDIVIESLDVTRVVADAFIADALPTTRRGLVVVSVTPFGRRGPNAAWRGEEIVTYAYAGPMASTGLRDREPVKMGADVGQYYWGTVAALAALAAVASAERSGRSIHVDAAAVDAQFGSIDRRTTYLLYQAFTGMDAPRSAGPTISPFPTGAFPTADGYVQITTAPRWIPRMLAVLGDDALAARYAAGDPRDDVELAQMAHDAVFGWTLGRTSQAAMEEGQAAGWPVTALKSPRDVLADGHLEQRGFWVDVDLGAGGTIRQPSAPVRFHAGGWELRRPAPALDAHRDEIAGEVASVAVATPAAKDVAARLPLEGVVVVDITAAWAGPFATQLLGDLGATVIRIDNPAIFPTNTRGVVSRPRAEQLPLL